MHFLSVSEAEAHSQETFHCGSCGHDFPARVITWIDVTRTPQARQALLRWEFNIIHCPHCGSTSFADTPFFYEDFEEGFLIAVFPRIPDDRGVVEASIRERYGYYPVLEYFYDMTQIWTLLCLQEQYKANRNLRALSRIGTGEVRLRKLLSFLKEDALMIVIREKLAESLSGNGAEDELMELLARAIYLIEEMLPWPLDRRCACGGDLTREFKCCGRSIKLDDQDKLLSRHYVVYCPDCGDSLAGACCEACGRIYTWKLGTVESHGREKRTADGRIEDLGGEGAGIHSTMADR